jgi:ribonucleoside-diphosphate reductase subunit M2
MGDTPVKKLSFDIVGKENLPFDAAVPIVSDIEIKEPFASDNETKKPIVGNVNTEKRAVVAPTIRPEEADEPLLQENPQRFVLFPIKYHEVRVASS